MQGRIRKKLLSRIPQVAEQQRPLICPLCLRPIPESEKDAHHLVPKSKGGRETQYLHRVCHRQIHALLTETELARVFNSVEALLQHPEVARFVSWIRSKPPDFYEKTNKSQRVRKVRR